MLSITLFFTFIWFYGMSSSIGSSESTPEPTALNDEHHNIAFQVYRSPNVEIHSVDINGVEKRLWLTNKLIDTNLIWSPDGKHLAFTVANVPIDGGIGNIYIVDANGTNSRQLTESGGFSPSWSPDSKYLVFAANDGFYLIESSGKNPRRIASGPVFSGRSSLLSPNGRYLGYISSSTTTDEQEMYVTNILTGDFQVISNNKATIYSFAWSPDSNEIAFSSDHEGNDQRNIYISVVGKRDQRRLTKDGNYNDNPTWSPDGKFVAFSSGSDTSSHIAIINADGSGQKFITAGNQIDGFPSWSPDGKYIAFVSNQEGPQYNIYLVDIVRGTTKRLTKLDGEDSPRELMWQP